MFRRLNTDTSFPFEEELCGADSNNAIVGKDKFLNSWRLGALDDVAGVMKSLAHLGYSSHLRYAMTQGKRTECTIAVSPERWLQELCVRIGVYREIIVRWDKKKVSNG